MRWAGAVLLLLVGLLPDATAQAAPGTLALADALESVRRAEGLRFSYRDDVLRGLRVDTAVAKTGRALLAEVVRVGLVVEEVEPGAYLIARPRPGEGPGETRTRTLLIRDAEGPLPGATAEASDGRAWVSDPAGWLRLPAEGLPAELTIRFLGYAPLVRERGALPPDGGTLVLRPSPVAFDAVTVTAPLPPRPLRPVAAAGASAGGFGDSRLTLPPAGLNALGFVGMAGASGVDAGSAKPQLRGSAADETLVLLDGLPLFHIDHFFGLFSAVATPVVEEVAVYRSHYPIEQGGYRGGLLEITGVPADGNGLAAELSQVAAGLTGTARLGGFDALLSGRATLNGLLRDSLFGALTPDYAFRDGYARLRWGRRGDRWFAQANAFASSDRYGFRREDRIPLADDRLGRAHVTAFEEVSRWRNEGLRGELTYRPGPYRLTVDAYATRYRQDLATRSNLRRARRPNAPPVPLRDTERANVVGEERLGLEVAEARDTSRWRAGVQVQRLGTEADFRLQGNRPLDGRQRDVRLHGYGAYTASLGRRTRLETGLRATRSLGGGGWWSPRAELHYRPRAPTALRAGYSYTRQSVRTLQQENQFGQVYPFYVLEVRGRGEEPAAHNATIGARHAGPWYALDVEAYYRWLPGELAVRSTVVTRRGDTTLADPQPAFGTFAGEGRVFGVDVDLRYARRGLEGQVAYTLAVSQQRFAAVARDRWQRAPDDRRHRLATSHAYTRGRWSGGVAFEAASGLAFLDVDALAAADEDLGAAAPGRYRNSLPAYARLDVHGHYRARLGAADVTAGLRLFNVLDRANVSHREYVLTLEEVTGTPQPGRVAVGTDVPLLGRLLLVELGVRF